MCQNFERRHNALFYLRSKAIYDDVCAYFILEQLIFKGYLDRAFYQAIGASMEGSPVLPIIAVLVINLLIAYLYPIGYAGGSPAGEGFRCGLFLGLFLAMPFSLFTGAMFQLGGSVMLVLILVTLLEVMASGVAVGLVYGRINTDK